MRGSQLNTLDGAFEKTHRLFGADDELCATTARRYVQEVATVGHQLALSIDALKAFVKHAKPHWRDCDCGLADVLVAVETDLDRWNGLVKLIGSDSEIPSFTADGWFVLEGRGWCASFTNSIGKPDPDTLKGKRVIIDGDEYTVVGVETHAISRDGRYPEGLPFGLVIGERRDRTPTGPIG